MIVFNIIELVSGHQVHVECSFADGGVKRLAKTAKCGYSEVNRGPVSRHANPRGKAVDYRFPWNHLVDYFSLRMCDKSQELLAQIAKIGLRQNASGRVFY